MTKCIVDAGRIKVKVKVIMSAHHGGQGDEPTTNLEWGTLLQIEEQIFETHSVNFWIIDIFVISTLD